MVVESFNSLASEICSNIPYDLVKFNQNNPYSRQDFLIINDLY